MIFKKKEEELACNTVECSDCGVVLLKSYAQCVTTDSKKCLYYCKQHTKNYDSKVWRHLFGMENGDYVYYKKFRVSEDGTPIGYTHDPKANS